MDFRGLIWKQMCKITLWGLKSGQDLKNRAANPHQEFPGVQPSPPPRHREGTYTAPRVSPKERFQCKKRFISNDESQILLFYPRQRYIQKKKAKRRATWGFPIFWTDKPSFFKVFFIKCLKPLKKWWLAPPKYRETSSRFSLSYFSTYLGYPRLVVSINRQLEDSWGLGSSRGSPRLR